MSRIGVSVKINAGMLVAIVCGRRGAYAGDVGQDEERRLGIWNELKAVRTRGLGRIDIPEKPGRKGIPTPHLEKAAKAVPGYHHRLSRLGAIDLLLKQEVAVIEAPAYREQLVILFGLDDKFDNTRPSELKEIAAERAGQDAWNYGRDGGTMLEILWILAGQIAADCFVEVRSSIATHLQAYAGEPFVERETYAATFMRLLEQGHRCIVLNGGRGNGKSRLALELVARQPRAVDHGVYVNASSPNTLAKDLRAILTARDKPTGNLSDGFVELVSAPDAPPYVILDNVEAPELVDDLVPSDSRSTIVVTANRQIPEYKHSSLEVMPMTEAEADELVRNLLPVVAIDQAEQVARALGYRPLAIVHACGFILGDGLVSVEQFLHDLRADAAQTMRVPAVADERTLTTIYELTLQHLGQLQDDPKARVLARDLLELIACVAPDDIPPDLLLDGMRGDTEDDVSSTKFQEAVLALRARFLIRVINGRLAIHPLTQMILRALLRSKEQALCLALHSSVQYSLRHQDRSKPVRQDVIDAVPHISKIVFGLQEIDADKFRSIGLDHTLAVILRASRQIGLRRAAFRTVVDDTLGVVGERVFARVVDDSSDLNAADDILELTREMIPYLFSVGEVDELEYLHHARYNLGVRGDSLEVSTLNRLSIGDLIDLATATLPCSSSAALGILSSQAERARVEADGPIQYGDFKTLYGESQLTAAAWADAWTSLREALQLYGQAGINLLAIRGTARVVKLLGDLVLYGGRRAPMITKIAEDLVETRRDFLEQDVLTAAYLRHYFTRQMVAEFIRKWIPFVLVEVGASDIAVDKGLLDQARSRFALGPDTKFALSETVAEYLLGNYAREAHDLSYDGTLVYSLLQSGSLRPELLREFQPRGRFVESPLLVARFELAKFKSATMYGTELGQAAFQLLYSNLIPVGKHDSWYWYTECLAAACILSAQCGLTEHENMLGHLQDFYARIDRPERAAHVIGCIESWQKGNRREFIRRFAPLVSF